VTGTVLLERGDALAALDSAVASARRGRGGVVLVAGEPGIGKTALVSELLANRAKDARRLCGVCDDLSTPRPFAPFHDLARTAEEPLRSTLARLLAAAVRDPVSAALVPHVLLEDLRASPVPTVLVVEDVHWADQATVDALTVVGRRLADVPAVLVLTVRPGEVEPDHPFGAAVDVLHRASTIVVELAPLSADAVRQLGGEDAEQVLSLTGGNPFFVREILAHGPDPPPSLTTAVLARVSRLEAPARELLDLLAVAPGRLDAVVLDRLRPGWPGEIHEAERRGLVSGDAAHARFCHELARRAVLSQLTPSRRRLLHQRVLEALLATGADHADVVHHAEAAGATDVVARHALPAAREADTAGASREAYAHYRRAADHLDELDIAERARFHEDLSRAAYLSGHSAAALAAADEAVALHRERQDRKSLGACLYRRSHLSWFLGDGRAAWADACASVRALERTGARSELARACAQVSSLSMLASRADEAAHWGARALQLAADDDQVRAAALVSLGSMEAQLERDDRTVLVEGLELALRAGAHHEALLALTSLAWTAVAWVRPGVAAAHCHQARRLAKQLELDALEAYVDGIRAGLLSRRGAWEDAERLARAASRKRDPRCVPALQARTVLAEIALRRGDPAAGGLLDELVVDVERTGELKRVGPVLELEVERALLTGDELPAERLEQLAAVVGPSALARGVSGARAAAWARVFGWPSPHTGPAPLPHAALLAGDPQAASEAFEAVGWRYDRALALSLSDEPGHLQQALVVAESMGAGPLGARVRRRMADLGVRAPRPSTLSNPCGLTDRQVEVLAHVAAGASNEQIARTLHLSQRTVEHHVSGVLLRLGASTRAEAVARAHDEGVVLPRSRAGSG
jgi:DNA-binding CsgD family transcriptional regulator